MAHTAAVTVLRNASRSVEGWFSRLYECPGTFVSVD